MSRALSLGFDLQRIVVRPAGIVNIIDGGKLESGIGHTERRSIRTASQGVSGGSAGAGRVHIDIISELQNVGTARARITHGQYNLAGQLLLDIDVELLNSALLEVGILRQNSTGEIGWVGG